MTTITPTTMINTIENEISAHCCDSAHQEKKQRILSAIREICNIKFPTTHMFKFVSYDKSKSFILEENKQFIDFDFSGNSHVTYYEESATGRKYKTIADIENLYGDNYVIQPNFNNTAYMFVYNKEYNAVFGLPYKYNESNNEYQILESLDYWSSPTYVISNKKDIFALTAYHFKLLKTDNFYNTNWNENLVSRGRNRSFYEAISNMYSPIVNIGANQFVALDRMDRLMHFFNYKAKLEKKNGPKQKKIDELVSLPLPESKVKSTTFDEETGLYAKTQVVKVAENTCCIRWTLFSQDGNNVDGFRIYVEGKNVYACKLNSSGEYVRTTISNIKPENFLSNDMDDINPDDLKGTILQYFGSIINDIPSEYRSIMLISFVTDNSIESLYKIGLAPLIYSLFNSRIYDIKKYLVKTFLYNPKEKNIMKALGLNKHQLEKYIDTINSCESIQTITELMAALKSVFGIDAISIIRNSSKVPNVPTSISHIDDDTFDLIFDAIIKVNYVNNYTLNFARSMYNDIMNYNPKLLASHYKNIATVFRNSSYEYNLRYDFTKYNDFVTMFINLDNRHLKFTFSNTEELNSLHDATMALYEIKKMDFKRDAFVSAISSIEDLKYDKDDNYCVVVPQNPEDVANEGLELHHCVKSYIDKIIARKTNIVFIREKSDVNKPFYTVEVSLEHTVEQVHGFGNSNVEKNSDLEKFIKKWIKAKNLKGSNYNKIR